jgi:NADPH-dependent 2,4-dienoyl-CoA reductase/sulfur reductase-like enzyme/rhodanese-related sulfurtransferase
MSSKRVLIVGGVAGGASCAARLRRLDEQAEIFLYERGADVSFANCGMPYCVGEVIDDRQRLLVASPARFRDLFKVEVRTHREVLKIDRVNKTVEVKNLQTGEVTIDRYDVLVLAPGASPIKPPLPGVDLPGIFTLRNLSDMDQIAEWIDRRAPRRAVVVGGGFIGLEMVENLCHRKLDVTVLERLDQVMPPMDPEMVAPIQGLLKSKGVDLRLSNGVISFASGPQETITVTATSGEPFAAELVILSVGVRPDAHLARQSGLEIGELGGIRVDQQMRTSDPAIFAVGDAVEVRDWVTGRWKLVPLAGPANRQGRIAADAICGRSTTFRGSQGTAIVGVFGITAAVTGASEKTLQAAGIPYRKTYTHSPSHATYYPGAEQMAVKLLYVPESGQLLGAQVVGRSGVDKRIDVLAMALQKHATVFDLEEAELAYAPQYGSAKDAINIAGMVAANFLRGDVDVVHWEDWCQALESTGQPPLVIDVRPASMAATGSAPGAINIPLGELRARLDELPCDREIWVHCGTGQTSYYANRILKQLGFAVRNLSGGITSFRSYPARSS